MATKLTNYLNDFQDMFLDVPEYIQEYNENIIQQEFNILYKKLEVLSKEYNTYYSTVEESAKEFEKLYKQSIQNIHDKIKYINASTNSINSLVKLYDETSMQDYHIYNLNNNSNISNLYYSNISDSVVLKHDSIVHKTSKEVTATSVKFYNSSTALHSAIRLDATNLQNLSNLNITIQKTDGTTLSYSESVLDVNNIFILEHDLLNSIIIEITPENYDLNIINTLELSLIKNEYHSHGFINLDALTFKKSDYLTFNSNKVIPNNTFINLILNLNLINDENKSIKNIDITFPLGNSLVCKKINEVDWNTIEKVNSIVIDNMFSNEKVEDIYYLKTLSNVENSFIIYQPKAILKDVVNNFNINYNEATVEILFKYFEKYESTVKLEFISFNKNYTPSISSIIGISKNAT